MMLVYFAKAKDSSIWLFITAFLINALGIYIWMYSMKKGIESATAITVYALMTMAGCTLLGNMLFHEHLSIVNWVGISLAAIALILISI